MTPAPVLVAPDTFKGSPTAAEVATGESLVGTRLLETVHSLSARGSGRLVELDELASPTTA
jgi:hypothetical protein